MGKIVIFGAGGKAGSRAVAEATQRGHEVTAVVRDTDRHRNLVGVGVTLIAGDVTDAASVARLAAGHDGAVSTVYRPDVPAAEFYGAAARALVAGLAEAGVSRLVVVGIGTTLEISPGVAVHDTPGFPAEGRTFSLGHAVELDVFASSDTGLDWVVVTPPPVVLDAEASRTGSYRIGGRQVLATDEGSPAFSYADLAVALIDEVTNPEHHREFVAVA